MSAFGGGKADITPMSSHGADETAEGYNCSGRWSAPKVDILSVDKAAVRDRCKLFLVAHVAVVVAADGAPVPAAAGAVAVAAVAVAAVAVAAVAVAAVAVAAVVVAAD